ncbi:MAG: hypothetical protein IKE03_05410 [Blautia sp.]|nr:hypothetical protein [Blautia sp.]
MEKNLLDCPLSLENIRANPSLFNQIRKEVVGGIASREFECVSLIEKGTGNSIVLYSPLRDDIPSKTGMEFRYDTYVLDYLEAHCIDIDPAAIIESLGREHIALRLKEAPSYTVYYNLTDDDNKILHHKASAIRLSFTDDFFCLTVTDLTDAFIREDQRNAHLEKALEEARTNLDANNAFLSLISRDIRTPLHSIIGLTRIANAQLKDISAVESYLHKISMSGTYMEQTINDIKDYIRISWHPIELRMEAIDLGKFTAFVRQVFSRQAAERELHFTCHTEGIQVSKIRTDPAALRQIFLKLTGNIMNYTLRGGTIELRIATEPAESDRVRLTIGIQSRGMDLDQDRLGILLESYEYVMNEVHSNINSIDMDLVILKAYLQAMDAKVRLESRKGIRTGIVITMEVAGQDKAQGTSGTFISRVAIPSQATPPSFKGRQLCWPTTISSILRWGPRSLRAQAWSSTTPTTVPKPSISLPPKTDVLT